MVAVEDAVTAEVSWVAGAGLAAAATGSGVAAAGAWGETSEVMDRLPLTAVW